MFRPHLFCLLLAPVATAADPVPGQPVPEENVETLIKLRVEPRRPPTPALKFQLLPEAKELQPGNPIFGYMRCFAEHNEYFYSKEAAGLFEKWLEVPIGELPRAVRIYTDGGPLKRLDAAARLDQPYWNMAAELKRDGILTLLPDVQILRHLSGWNKIRMRYAVQEGRFEDVISFAKSGFQMSRHMDENHTMIGDLVGVAMGTVTLGPLEEMMTQSGAPNLFWAYGFLPRPFVPNLKGTDGEMALVYADFGDLSDPNRLWDADDLALLAAKVNELPNYADLRDGSLKVLTEWVVPKLTDKEWLAAERKRLVEEDGLPQGKVKKYPPEQVVFHAMLRKYAEGRDEVMKYLRLPFHEAQDHLLKYNRVSGKESSVEEVCQQFLANGTRRSKMAVSRLDQRLAMLQIAEGLRWYAADHDGNLPRKLDDFLEPLPDDPMTGKPFKYECDGTTAHLRGTPPKGMERARGHLIHYEITVRK